MYQAFDNYFYHVLHCTSIVHLGKLQGMQLDIHFHHYQRFLTCMCLAMDIQYYQVLQNKYLLHVSKQLGRRLDNYLLYL